MLNKTIAVIGQGFVGGSLTTVFSECGFEVLVYDKLGKIASGGKQPLTEQGLHASTISEFVHACENLDEFSKIYFVCLPTPMFENGSADLTIIESVLEEISKIQGERIIVIKSTIPPGSTEKWNIQYGERGMHIIFNPEFLTEANALNDMRNQNRIILGGPRPWINNVKQIFQTAFPKIHLIKTSSTTAEMVKYLTNNFLTVKVAFANEMSQICEALDKSGLDVDYDKVIEYAKYDKRLGESHWSVPGPDGAKGFGGHCFPKDINAMIDVAKKNSVDPKILTATWEKNLEVRNPDERDWEKMVDRAITKKKV